MLLQLRSRTPQLLALCVAMHVMQPAVAAGAPPWLRALVSAPLPAHDEKTDAVLLYSETFVSVQKDGDMRQTVRQAFKILRNDGRGRGIVRVDFNDRIRVTDMRGWAIPTQGKDYEVLMKDTVESAVLGVDGGELVSDSRTKLLAIPAASPGNIVGYEVSQQIRPQALVAEWDFQDTVPTGEARYSLQLPPGWSYKVTWINHAPQEPVASGPGQLQWTLKDIKPVKLEPDMPPWRGIAGRLVVALLPPDGKGMTFQNWGEVGAWYENLARLRREPSDGIRQRVKALTATQPTTLAKIQALAKFVQNDIRYVAIELGIGGQQPHPAADVFANRYGDCKDKVTLLSSMLNEIGVESYLVTINTVRGSIAENTPPNLGFNHAIVAIRLPADVQDPALLSQITHPKLGTLLFFDPTDTLTAFGRIPGGLQSNYGLLALTGGGELIRLPQLPGGTNIIDRTAKLQLNDKGALQGDVVESRRGDTAAAQRNTLRSLAQDTDRIRTVESMLAQSFTTFRIARAAVGNLNATELPFEWRYTIAVDDYAKVAGDLLLLRPRVLGSKSSGLLETKEPRVHPIEFDEPRRDTDVFVIELPAGYEVDSLPPPVSADRGFVAYESRTEKVGSTLRYTRTFEIRELSVPASRAEELKDFYRTIHNDERMVAVLKRAGT